MTTYNRERYIYECLGSLAAQTYRDIEIIVVDDGSKDNTIEKMNTFKNDIAAVRPDLKDRILLLAFPRNVGYAGPLTAGMFLTRGEFIAIQDSDDLSHPDRIMKQVHYLKKNSEVGLVGTLYSDFMNETSLRPGKPATWIRFGEDIKKTYERGGHCICHGTILLRGSVFDRLGGYTRGHGEKADYEFVARCVLGGVRSENLPEVLYYYRRHHLQMSWQEYFQRPQQ